jgi:hypothetical protein
MHIVADGQYSQSNDANKPQRAQKQLAVRLMITQRYMILGTIRGNAQHAISAIHVGYNCNKVTLFALSRSLTLSYLINCLFKSATEHVFTYFHYQYFLCHQMPGIEQN